MSVPHRDAGCPARGPGLSHHAEHPDYVCAGCNMQCRIETVTLEAGVFAFAEAPCVLPHQDLLSGRTGTNLSPIRNDGHTNWSRCITCGVEVEQRQAMTGPDGVSWGKGRTGSLRQQTRDQAVWEFLRWTASRLEP